MIEHWYILSSDCEISIIRHAQNWVGQDPEQPEDCGLSNLHVSLLMYTVLWFYINIPFHLVHLSKMVWVRKLYWLSWSLCLQQESGFFTASKFFMFLFFQMWVQLSHLCLHMKTFSYVRQLSGCTFASLNCFNLCWENGFSGSCFNLLNLGLAHERCWLVSVCHTQSFSIMIVTLGQIWHLCGLMIVKLHSRDVDTLLMIVN